MLYASPEVSGRRPDQPWPALYFNVENVHESFRKNVGALLAPPTVRFTAIFEPYSFGPVSLAIRHGSREARLSYEGVDSGLWVVASPDAEGESIPVARMPLSQQCTYSVSLSADFGSGIYRDAVLGSQRVRPQVVELVEGPTPEPVEHVVELLTGDGTLHQEMPAWAKEQLLEMGAEGILAAQLGGRIVLRHQPEPEIVREERPAPLVELQGDDTEESSDTWTFDLEGDVHIERAFAVEGS